VALKLLLAISEPTAVGKAKQTKNAFHITTVGAV
jgi:hypothetical protein